MRRAVGAIATRGIVVLRYTTPGGGGVIRVGVSRRRRHRRSTGRGAQLQLLLATLRRLTAEASTVDELAEALHVHRRTVWRVLAAIRAARLPLLAGRDPDSPARRYRLRRRWWEEA